MTKTGTERDYSEETDHSPAGFSAPDVELENGPVRCFACGEKALAKEIGVHMDKTLSTDDGSVFKVVRRYVHNNEECLSRILGQGEPPALNATEADRDD